MAIITRVSRAKKGTKSLKTTIPESISEFMEISDKDELEWKMHVQNDIRLAIVQKKQAKHAMKLKCKRMEHQLYLT
jgi:ubiquitin C-terminal hydrolase